MNPSRIPIAALPTPDLTVILPCYNEAETVEAVLRDWMSCLESRVASYEILVINDGSSDGSGRILDNLRKEFSKTLRVIHQLNLGPNAAVKRGIEASRGIYLLVIEGEGRYEPTDFFRMWDRRLGYLLVLGSRSHRLERFAHRALSQFQAWFLSWFFGVKLRDVSTPFRLIKRIEAIEALSSVPVSLIPVDLAVALHVGMNLMSNVLEVSVPHRPRKNAAGSEGLLRLFWRALKTSRGLFLFWLERPRLPMIPFLISRREAQ